MQPDAVDQAYIAAICWLAFCAVLLTAGAIIDLLRISRRRDRENHAPEPDTIPYRNARGLAEYQRKRRELDQTGAET